MEATGLPEGLLIHDLRHTAVAILKGGGVHPEAIKRFLGHSSIMVTMDIYGHLSRPNRRRSPMLSMAPSRDLRRTRDGQDRTSLVFARK